MIDSPAAAPSTEGENGSRTLWAWAVGTFFGVGLLKPGPGTWGSVAALLLWAFAILLPVQHVMQQPGVGAIPGGTLQVLLAALLATAIGIPAATIVARESGREDPGHVVIDEVAGQWLTLVVCKPDGPHALLALGLFRFFDITKPFPIRRLELLPGGWGIMLDDLGAGIYAAVVLVLIERWW